ncbi:MAG TPA: hypothetical protein VNX22_05755 [Acidobacteriaceae bacterium]|nr:hypothetical protein [Acidobacteriaceae bacterium]
MSKPASRSQEYLLVAMLALVLAAISLSYCYSHGLLLLYGDAVAHLHIARRLFDSRRPGFRQLGTVWLPLPHLLMLPFVNMAWWRNGLAGAWPSIACYIAAATGIYRLARFWLPPLMSLVAFAAFALNPGLLYFATTAMTEPLFLAEMIWAVVFLVAFRLHMAKGERAEAQRALIRMTLVLVAAIFTRYDGWVLAFLAWLFVVQVWFPLRRNREMTRAFIVMTTALAIAPLIWLVYNQYLSGDALDFLRGPYSAKAIDARTTRPGSPHYPGYHSMRVAAVYFFKSAKLGAGSGTAGDWIAWLAAAGCVVGGWIYRKKSVAPLLLLWLPLAFYAYCIAYGAVPIFLPIWWPFSWYNTRYGMELLPTLALFPVFLFALIPVKLARWRDAAAVCALALIVFNAYRTARATPLVLQEARANSATRIPFERALARTLVYMPPRVTLLMYTSQYVGALQRAGIPLKQTLNEGDFREWQAALLDPAGQADYVLATDGDAVAAAVKAHPQGLQEVSVICSTGQPCARLYVSPARAARSDLYTGR